MGRYGGRSAEGTAQGRRRDTCSGHNASTSAEDAWADVRESEHGWTGSDGTCVNPRKSRVGCQREGSGAQNTANAATGEAYVLACASDARDAVVSDCAVQAVLCAASCSRRGNKHDEQGTGSRLRRRSRLGLGCTTPRAREAASPFWVPCQCAASCLFLSALTAPTKHPLRGRPSVTKRQASSEFGRRASIVGHVAGHAGGGVS